MRGEQARETLKISDLTLHRLDSEKQVANCPGCSAGYPSFVVERKNGEMVGFCPLCKLMLTEPIQKEQGGQKTRPEKATSLSEAIIDIDQFKGLDLPEKKKIISPWLGEQTITLIVGWRGVGKTWLALAICEAITRGINFGPWETVTPIPCLYIDGEMVPQDLRERIMALNNQAPRRAPFLVYNDCHANSLGLPRANLLNRRWKTEIKDFSLNKGIKLLVLDNISSLAPGIEENSKQAWDPINQWLLDLRFAGIATILLHHANKDGGQRGTSGREDNIDSSIVLHHPYDYSTEEGARFVLKFKKARVRNSDLPKIADTEFRLEEIGNRLEWTWGSVKGKVRIEALKMIDEGIAQKEIGEALQITKGYVSRIKSEAIRDGHLSSKGNLTQSGFALVNGIESEI